MKTIHFVGHPQPVLISSIVWLKGDANYTRVYFEDGTCQLVTQSLLWFEHHLSFIRIHRSTIINPTYVQAFELKSGRSGWVRLIDDRVFPVSRNRLKETATVLAGNNSFVIEND